MSRRTLDDVGVDEICERIASGESLRQIARSLDYTVGRLCQWLYADDERAKQYARAREMQGHLAASEVLEIADDPSLTPDERRVRIDARKWAAGRMAGRYYGDKQRIEHAGDADAPIVTEIRIVGIDGSADG